MKRGWSRSIRLALLWQLVTPWTGAASDAPVLDQIRIEARRSSQAFEIAQYLCDVIGPRLTGSPHLKNAFEWTGRKLETWGFDDVHSERWGPFGPGWTAERVAARMVAPDHMTLITEPRAWSPSTEGRIRGKAAILAASDDSAPACCQGQLAGRIVLLDPPTELRPRESPSFQRWSEQQLAMLRLPERPASSRSLEGFTAQLQRRRALRRFLREERVLATLESGKRDGGTLVVADFGDTLAGNDAPVAPALIVAAEQYNRIHRLIKRGIPVELEVELQTRWHREDLMSETLIAEIPGSDLQREVVMIGAHLDSWHGGAGATDNAAGVAVAMEAMRLLLGSGARPRRTIRLALWSGEEQGLLGSRAYVKRHFGWRDDPENREIAALPFFLRSDFGRLHLRPDHERFEAYFNLDHGTGRIRGIYLQGNERAASLIETWVAALGDPNVVTVSPRSLRGSDHQSFESVGLPAFMFIHDDAGYLSLAHHTNMDLCERLLGDDLVQASIVAASVVYQAAMSEVRLPRPPVGGNGR
ncbi:MAG: M20/M25/M40 family metallo-hydrolase [Vicinamibacteria bacterium]|nr:M20/M25/M40 family metallo-hydrolase [Vicinamibacteria bacterium]